MSDVNEEIVKLYFENNEFLIRTNIKYYIKGEKNVGGDSDIDILAYNLNPDKMHPPKNFVLVTTDLKGIEYAAIEVKGWHAENFSPSVIKNNERIFYITRKEADEKIKETIRTANYKKILVISSLGDKKEESIQLFQNGGIDHIIEFDEILNDLIEHTEVNKNYSSEALQMIRLLKAYGKLK